MVTGAEPLLPPGWVPAPQFSTEVLTGSFWSFGPMGQEPYSRFLVLAPDGLVGNYRNPNEELWQVVDGRLSLISNKGLATTTFDAAHVVDNRLIAIAGRVVSPGSVTMHVLTNVGHPPHPIAPTPPNVPRVANFIARPQTGSHRPNLVALRANEASLHPKWFESLSEGARNWDFCISYYGADPGSIRSPYEYLTHQPSQRKFQALFDLFYEGSPLWNYEHVWLPDDDLDISGNDINRLFHITRFAGLDLTQPSLAVVPGCYFSHEMTRQQPAGGVRLSKFVEIMCPVFSRRALKICHGTFKDSVSGFGLDYLWPALLGHPATRIGIIDDVALIHTRPIAAGYNAAAAFEEARQFLSAYHFRPA